MKREIIYQSTNSAQIERRKFIATSLKAMSATALLTSPTTIFITDQDKKQSYTVQDVIDIILKEIPGAPFPDTVDTIKSGNPNQQVAGIVSTMFPTVTVIEKAAELKANFIIAHEPTFYNHSDDPNWVPNNEVVKKKKQL